MQFAHVWPFWIAKQMARLADHLQSAILVNSRHAACGTTALPIARLTRDRKLTAAAYVAVAIEHGVDRGFEFFRC
jgi:hypothetical protein